MINYPICRKCRRNYRLIAFCVIDGQRVYMCAVCSGAHAEK